MEYDHHGRGRCGLSDFRKEVMGGKHPGLVDAYIQRESMSGAEIHRVWAANTARLWQVKEHHGIKIEVQMDIGKVTIHGAGLDAYLEEAIRKAGGRRTDKDTLVASLSHAHRLGDLLDDWIQLRRKQRATVGFGAVGADAQNKQRGA